MSAQVPRPFMDTFVSHVVGRFMFNHADASNAEDRGRSAPVFAKKKPLNTSNILVKLRQGAESRGGGDLRVFQWKQVRQDA